MKNLLIFIAAGVLSTFIMAVLLTLTVGSKPKAVLAGPEECQPGFQHYSMELVDYSFCFDPVLGTPSERETQISPEARRGTAYQVTFSESDVLVVFETSDFAKLGDSDVPRTLTSGFDCLSLDKTDSELAECITVVDEVYDFDAYPDKNGRPTYNLWSKVYQIETPAELADRYFLFIPDIKRVGAYNLEVSSSEYKDGMTRQVQQFFEF